MKVDIAIMTVREDEFMAVRKCFKTERQRIPDGRTYLIGEVKTEKQTYTIAIARCIDQGNDASQRLAHYIIHNLNPQLILVVGIAGGVPRDEFTLGDVIVSTHIMNPNVDAWQADGSTDYMTRGGPPHPSVEDIVSLLPGDPQLENWTSSIQFERPRLDPEQANIKGDDEWRKKVRESLNWHFGEEENRGRSPKYMMGPIISSNHLMKDPARLREILKTHRSILAVEMEVAGVYEAAQGIDHQYPVMAIRSISDIVGLQRDSRWTEYACQAAAAFTYAFIMTDPLDLPLNSASFQKPVVPSEISSAQLRGSGPSLDTQHSVWHLETMERLAQDYRDSIKFDAQIAYLQIPGMREPMALNTSYVHLRLHRINKYPDNFHTAETNRDPDEIMESDQEDLNKRAQTALTPKQVIREKTRCIIMGDPGSGKTTLLKHLALSSVNKDIEDLPDLPIYIKLNEFVESKCKSLLEFAAIDWDKRCGLSKANALSYLENRLRSGNLLMLLDALDDTKIGKTAQKAEASYLRAVHAIQDLTKISSTAPIVVTIRKAYLPETTLEGFSIFDVLDFQQKDIYKFVENWFKGQSASLIQIDIAGIKAKLDHNPRIIALAANPLMLSLILLTYHDQFEEIPERRAKLFERCVNMLLMEWNSKRKLRHPPRFDIEQKQLLLQYVAWHFHTRGQREFSENELLAAIAEFLNESKLSKYQILEEISNEDGLIKKIAFGVYGFLHLTLQEYFVAKYLATTDQLDSLLTHRGNPWWEEVFLLYADCLTEPSIFLNKLLGVDDKSPPEDLFYTNLILAGYCLSARPDLRRREVYWKIVDRLFEVFMDSSPDIVTKERIATTLVKVEEEEVIDRLIEILSNPKTNHHLYDLIINALDKLRDRSMAYKLLPVLSIKHIEYDPLRDVPWALVAIGERSVVPEMINLLLDKRIHKYVRGEIADALGKLGDQSAIPLLLKVLSNPHLDQYVAQWTARALSHLCDTSTLHDLLPIIANIWVDWGVCEILLDILEEQANQSTAQSLLSVFYDLRFSNLVNEITTIFSKIETRPLTYTIQIINMLLWIYQRSIVCSRSIIETLGKMKERSIAGELLSLLANPQIEDILRWECARALGRLGEQKIIPGLLNVLLDNQVDTEVRECVADAIGILGDDSIVPQLFSLLPDVSITSSIRQHIVNAIGNLGKRSVVNQFLTYISDESLDTDMRCEIVSVLENIEEDAIVEKVEPLLPHNHVAITGVIGRPSASSILSLLSKDNIEVSLRNSIFSALETFEKDTIAQKLERLLSLDHLSPIVREHIENTLKSLKALVISHYVQIPKSQNLPNKKRITLSDERRLAETKAKMIKLVQSLQKLDTSCFTKLQGYPKNQQSFAIASKIEEVSDIYYKLWDFSQQLGVRVFIINTPTGTELKLVRWGTPDE